mmetsp:Transcript_23574/g.70674  ORF Transcript_23574/g.70674 Transcript_23574/m.70674 type:complete len:662 (-) Transcript_23574:45-2030(-)
MPVIRTDGIAWAPETPAARHAIAARLAKDPTACAAAPPSARLALVLARCHALEATRRAHELKGEAWRSGGISPSFSWVADARDSTSDAPPLLDVLIRLRMRAVALCRLCHGTAAPDTLEALLDLARAYAASGLWLQAEAHAKRVVSLLTETPARVDDGNDVVSMADEAAATSVLGLFSRLASIAAAAAHQSRVPWHALVTILANAGEPRLAEQPWGVLEGADGFARRPDVPGGDLSWAGVVSFLRVAHGGFAAVTRRLEAVAPTHDTAALDHAFRAAVVTPGAGAAFAAPLRDAVIASSSAAAALAGSGLAVWLCARVDADAARGAAAAPVTWEECVAALVACPFPVSVGGTTSLSPRAAVQRVANLRARAHVLCGRAHARRGELAAAAHVLRSALHASKNADRPSGAVAADAHAALADVAVAACAVSRRRGDVALQWIDSEAEEFAATCESRRHHANGTTADAKADAEWTPDVRAKASVTVRPTCSGSPGAARDPAATAAASHLERAEAASEVVYGRVTSNFAAALVLAARGALAAATGDDKAACDTFARAEVRLGAAGAPAPRAATNVRLARILRRYPSRRHEAARRLSAAAVFYNGCAVAAAEVAAAAADAAVVDRADTARTQYARLASTCWAEAAEILRRCGTIANGPGLTACVDAL